MAAHVLSYCARAAAVHRLVDRPSGAGEPRPGPELGRRECVVGPRGFEGRFGDFTTGAGGVVAVTNNSTVSSDATLSGLTVSIEPSSGTTLVAVALSPSFDEPRRHAARAGERRCPRARGAVPVHAALVGDGRLGAGVALPQAPPGLCGRTASGGRTRRACPGGRRADDAVLLTALDGVLAGKTSRV